MRQALLATISAFAVLTTGCASRPRNFTPELAAAPSEQAAYETTLASCQMQGAQAGGKPAGSKVAAGAGSAAVGGATAGGASWGAAAASAAAIVALPVLGLVWGLSRSDRAKKERRIKQAVADCLADYGYTVARWKRVKPARQIEAEAAAAAGVELPASGEGKVGHASITAL